MKRGCGSTSLTMLHNCNYYPTSHPLTSPHLIPTHHYLTLPITEDHGIDLWFLWVTWTQPPYLFKMLQQSNALCAVCPLLNTRAPLRLASIAPSDGGVSRTAPPTQTELQLQTFLAPGWMDVISPGFKFVSTSTVHFHVFLTFLLRTIKEVVYIFIGIYAPVHIRLKLPLRAERRRDENSFIFTLNWGRF